mgnify:CR=1 FL=1
MYNFFYPYTDTTYPSKEVQRNSTEAKRWFFHGLISSQLQKMLNPSEGGLAVVRKQICVNDMTYNKIHTESSIYGLKKH